MILLQNGVVPVLQLFPEGSIEFHHVSLHIRQITYSSPWRAYRSTATVNCRQEPKIYWTNCCLSHEILPLKMAENLSDSWHVHGQDWPCWCVRLQIITRNWVATTSCLKISYGSRFLTKKWWNYTDIHINITSTISWILFIFFQTEVCHFLGPNWCVSVSPPFCWPDDVAIPSARTVWCSTATATPSWSAAWMPVAPLAPGARRGGCWPSPSALGGRRLGGVSFGGVFLRPLNGTPKKWLGWNKSKCWVWQEKKLINFMVFKCV